MQDNMLEIEQTEAVIEDERSALKAHFSQIDEEQRHIKDQLSVLDKRMRNMAQEHRALLRESERKIEMQ